MRREGGEGLVGFPGGLAAEGGEVDELGEFFAVGKVDGADAAMPVLADNELGHSRLIHRVIVLAPKEEHHNIRILLKTVVNEDAVGHKVVHFLDRRIKNVLFA